MGQAQAGTARTCRGQDHPPASSAPLAANTSEGPLPCPALPRRRFPEEKPQLSVQAARHAGSADSSFVVLRNCPWSPRWPPGEMGARLFNFVKDEVAAMMRKAGPQ